MEKILVQTEAFLSEFKTKLSIWDIIFRSDRQKNTQTLLDLDIRVADVRAVLAALLPSDYVAGPLPDTLYGGSPMWVFGRLVKGCEIYIKITLGRPNNPTICISFHAAEHPLTYPLRV